MKLRIEPKSLRIRLSEEEFDLIQTRNRLSEKIELEADNYFTYIITAGNYSDIHASFTPSGLEIRIPFSVLKHWAVAGDTGISSKKAGDLEAGKPVVIIEKDLPPRKWKKD